MNKSNVSVLNRGADSVLATNKVLRNTYLLLGLTFIFSAFTAYASFAMAVRSINPLIFIFGAYGLMFLTNAHFSTSPVTGSDACIPLFFKSIGEYPPIY